MGDPGRQARSHHNLNAFKKNDVLCLNMCSRKFGQGGQLWQRFCLFVFSVILISQRREGEELQVL